MAETGSERLERKERCRRLAPWADLGGLAPLFDASPALEDFLRNWGTERCARPGRGPAWAKQLSKGAGFAASIAGFLRNSIKDGRFLFRDGATPAIRRKTWGYGTEECLSAGAFQELDDDEKSQYRRAYRLSLPDMLLHGLVGKFLTWKIDHRLSDDCFAYRRTKQHADAVRRVRKLQAGQDRWVVKFDIASFNETVDHDILTECLEERVLPLLSPADCRIVVGTVEALRRLSWHATGERGKGLVVGSGLTPPLTNLYLWVLDEHVENLGIPFARYGDDLIAFCDSEAQANNLLGSLCKVATDRLRQKPSRKNAELTSDCWRREVAARLRELRTGSDAGTDERVAVTTYLQERSGFCKSDIYPPGTPFDFVGFDFHGPRVMVRHETIARIKSRIAKHTQRSIRDIEVAVGDDDPSWGAIATLPGADDVAIPSINYLRRAIRRVNRLLGYETQFDVRRPLEPVKVEFMPHRTGFAPWVLACVDYQDVKVQFQLLDSYIVHRLRGIQSARRREYLALCPPKHADLFRFDQTSPRKMGFRTFKDVANRWGWKADKHR